MRSNLYYHECQDSEGGEADLHKMFAGCQKNPGHRQFIPIDTLTIKHLPENHRNKDLYALIKAVADLTVRVDVNMVSHRRPEVWPQSNRLYPFYNLSRSSNMRTGSGMIRSAFKCPDDSTIPTSKCWCRKCEHSDSASNAWWEFYVDTATHLVFDDIEARHTSLRLFYDRDDSPVVFVNKVKVARANVEDDRCLLKCVTCDDILGEMLERKWNHYIQVWTNVKDVYQSSRDSHKLMFIVSHPHGCSKQVSIGQWKDKILNKADDKVSRFTYKTSTCPGSSGAVVNCVGFRIWWSDLVHSGSLKSGLNYSGAGFVI
ncbi:hypothetical protein BgiMline_021017 [Biomphalaria glabrata]|nr:hypothetical protein BgiMline_018177 [Biomphalaria glabrata]KAI8771080.1 hypothetical protein BgiBS90_027799 [Biomphalaria glabrata]